MSDMDALLDFLAKLPETSGRVSFDRDELYGLSVRAEQDHGYTAACLVKGVTFTGRGLTTQEAGEKLLEKLKRKYQV